MDRIKDLREYFEQFLAKFTPQENAPAKVLVLGGGGARGLAHVGVIRVLEEHGWVPDLITGSSMGAIIGAVYALKGSAQGLEEILQSILTSKWYRDFGLERFGQEPNGLVERLQDMGTHIRQIILLTTHGKWKRPVSLLPSNFMLSVMDEVFHEMTFEDTKIPLIVTATDLYSGQSIDLRTGPIARAVAGSSSIPGIFAPVEYDEMLLVDGFVTRNIPVPLTAPETAQAREIIAVDVLPALEDHREPMTPVDILNRVDAISQHHLNKINLDMADVVIAPDVRHFSWNDFGDIEKIIQAGADAAMKLFEPADSISS